MNEVPFSIKMAITAGALLGGTVALVNNKERVLEFGEKLFQGGADFCKESLEKHKQGIVYAADLSDGELEDYDSESATDLETLFSKSEMTTPDASDVEWEHDLEIDLVD
ncbi:hypothetical protein CANTEDRAFT_116670 [Yamadazyma tenuis ATCC 10573]|uniref:Uncharacterized protein n=1 Tax=Candida tenuis (strain ATCC 10573 / BCRC 21748 / CBS 615 / JCM 9827 / NBRC 10315 / NRRL Y-1498 / VKM Y-70) TaxID=590646 RepID=G3BEU4_CANTC|nr:uncharacterized protein CANTEDRAFT_116670 [Yamadazyma tenuis ATCC 10573]EGV61212.1 hypothetical protein CANTEDRAFT_116670 [Yamadazyma tenuis ATCC 10573]